MATPADVIRPAREDGEPIPPLSFQVPTGFHHLPLASTEAERAELADAFVRELYSRGDESVWTPAAPYYARIAELLADNGLSYSAVGLFSTDEDGVAQCAFTVAAVENDSEDPDVVARGILAVLSEDPLNDARWLDLPCGPAVSCVTLREASVPAGASASGEEVTLLTGQIQVHVPFPTGPYTAVFTLFTASTDHWGEFCDITATILQTVSFTDQEAEADPLAEPEGGP